MAARSGQRKEHETILGSVSIPPKTGYSHLFTFPRSAQESPITEWNGKQRNNAERSGTEFEFTSIAPWSGLGQGAEEEGRIDGNDPPNFVSDLGRHHDQRLRGVIGIYHFCSDQILRKYRNN